MPLYKYFGNPAIYHGKPLFHILCNLKDFGKGRIVTRTVFKNDTDSDKPSFYRILWAQPLMDKNTLEGRVVAEKVRRGVRYTEPVDLADLAPVPDFRLVDRIEEEKFCKWDMLRDYSPDVDYVTEPKYFTLPPLLQLLMERNMTERKETPVEDSFLLPHFKTYIPKNTEVLPGLVNRAKSRVELHQETVTRCEGVASYVYADNIDKFLAPQDDILSDLPQEPPMPNPAVGMRLYRWPDSSRSHKEEPRTDEHNTFFP